MCKYCGVWNKFPAELPPNLDIEYLVEDHEGNRAIAFWDGYKFDQRNIPFGKVISWAFITHFITGSNGDLVSIVAASDIHSVDEMYDREDPYVVKKRKT